MKVIHANYYLNNNPLCDPMNRMLKRAFDVAFSILVLVFVFPPAFLLIGIAIKCTMPGAIIFSQKRTGKNGKEFICYKFRTMVPNSESDMLQAHDNDMRITRLGRLLRRTSLDELPQFWNVLCGDMSVVGPRPHMIAHTNLYSPLIPYYSRRLEVKPGLTGWAQVHNLRGETYNSEKMRKRVKYDLWYIQNWSFSLDLQTIWMTVDMMISELVTFGREESIRQRSFSPRLTGEEVHRCSV
ncbi:MAG: exopolysaccharide biosynthesis polyprenyl glycosylphosphotransferase [Prevotellaceae bacterium]|jgi:putative colanic acid biosynthesis UDP-glucose lipid carrier transferase|nr:exopolysaccharide biosynthesis polyprenyl glycosylphosphotransferase [Prevotellaceae bacterium]